MTVSTWEVCIPSREQTWRVQALRVAELLWRIGSRSDELFVFTASQWVAWKVDASPSLEGKMTEYDVTESYAKSQNF